MIEIEHLDDEPYPPTAGEVYWISTDIADGFDPKASRPALVVIEAPLNGRITVVARTSDTTRQLGVGSPINPDLGFNKPGVWGHVRTVDSALWTPSMVTFMGAVAEGVLAAVRAEFQL